MAQLAHVAGGVSAPPVFQEMADGSFASVRPIIFPREPEFRQREEILANMRINLARGLPTLKPGPKHDGDLILVAGGPSLANEMLTLRMLAERPGNRIVTANDSHDFLINRGIVPWGATYWEVGSPKKASFLDRPHKGVRYFIASQAHPEVFDKLIAAGADITVWHVYHGFPDKADVDLVFEHDPEGFMAGGGAGATLRWVYVGHALWQPPRTHIFGMDSSFTADQTHAYKQRQDIPKDESWRLWDVFVLGKKFTTNSFLLHQADHFQWQMQECKKQGIEVTIYGDGLIPEIARQIGVHVESRRAERDVQDY